MDAKLKTVILYAIMESNHLRVRRIMQLTELQHKTLIFETGMEFLENRFGKESPRVKKYSLCNKYWLWWIHEHHRWEHEFLHFYNQHYPVVCEETLQMEMTELISGRITVKRFHNYLKAIKNEFL